MLRNMLTKPISFINFAILLIISWSNVHAWTIPTKLKIYDRINAVDHKHAKKYLDQNSKRKTTSRNGASGTELRMIWPFDNKSDEPTSNTAMLVEEKDKLIKICKEIGRGSYGIVHLCNFHNDNDEVTMIAKRALTGEEIEEKLSKNYDDDEDYDPFRIKNKVREKLKRCNYYFNVEKHCFEKIQSNQEDSDDSKLPKLIGTFKDIDDDIEWMVFSLIERDNNIDDSSDVANPYPAITLGQAIKKDWIDQHDHDDRHHLSIIQNELGLPESTTFEETLDTIFLSLLQSVSYVHKYNIVHRDIKPDNLICNPKTNSLVLIDFGSAADIDPLPNDNKFFAKKRVGLDDDNIVAISPIYSAPEIFIRNDNTKLSNKIAYNFDTFSCALIFLQLLFNLLDERTDAAFRQQLEMEADYDLDLWFADELLSTIRPVGLEDGLNYLSLRPGKYTDLR